MMAKIIVQTNDGEEIKSISASGHNLRNSPYSLLSILGLISEIIKAIEEALDREE